MLGGADEPECSGHFDLGLIHQQNGNVIAHGVNPSAFGAFQAFAVFGHSQPNFAERANQNIQEILGNHERIVLHRL